MVKRKKYSIDFKLQVVGKYEQGTCGYKKLARAYGLSRDTVRSWCLNPRLREITTMARKKKNNNEENDLEYYKTAALLKHYYEQQRQNKQHLPKNILNRQFYAAEPLTKLAYKCIIFSYHKRMAVSKSCT